MNVLLYNTIWMTWNILLAFSSLIFAYALVKVKDPVLKGFFAILWLLFVPNTVYIFTDVIHIPEQLHQIDAISNVFWFFQYVMLLTIGLLTFLKSMQLVELEIVQWLQVYAHKSRKYSHALVISIITVLNFVIAFGVAMGRVQRTNSWHLLTDPIRVLQDSMATANSSHLLGFVFLFGIGIHCIYLALRRV